MSVCDKVLLAVYIESLYGPGERVAAASGLGLRTDVYNYAVAKLQAEGMIEGVAVLSNPADLFPAHVEALDMRITEGGARYVEGLIGADGSAAAADALRMAYRFAAEREWYFAADLVMLALTRV